MSNTQAFVARAAALRETAKWMAAIFAATGAVLFSGLSFANIQTVAAADNWVLPVALAVVPILSAAVAIAVAADLMTRSSLTAADIVSEERSGSLAPPVLELREQIEHLATTPVATYGSIQGFEDRLAAVRQGVETANVTFEAQRTPENRRALEAEFEKLSALQSGVEELFTCADFVQVRDRYQRARWALLLAALVGVAAAAGSGIVAARMVPETADAPATAPVTTPLAVKIYFGETPPNSPCPIASGQRAIAIGGTMSEPVLLFPATSEGAGNKCRTPWTWEPGVGTVVTVPRSAKGMLR